MQVHLVAIARDEGNYITEWLAYHLSLGIDRIFVYDHDSVDDTSAILEKARRQYPVARKQWSTPEGKSPQFSAYADYLEQHRQEDCLTGFIDIDEFLMSCDGSNPVDTLRLVGSDPTVGAICINQRVFGGSGLDRYSPGPVLKRFPRCSTSDYHENRWLKSFYRLTAVERLSIHSSALTAGRHIHPNGQDVVFSTEKPFSIARDVDHSLIQLNHYLLKSREEFEVKRQRGGGAEPTKEERIARWSSFSYETRDAPLNAELCEETDNAAAGIEELIERFERGLPLDHVGVSTRGQG